MNYRQLDEFYPFILVIWIPLFLILVLWLGNIIICNMLISFSGVEYDKMLEKYDNDTMFLNVFYNVRWFIIKRFLAKYFGMSMKRMDLLCF